MVPSLPPGFRFYPSEQELLNHYLTGKNISATADHVGLYIYDLIRDLNLFDYNGKWRVLVEIRKS